MYAGKELPMSLLWDNHMHSSFSGDCDIPAKEMAAAAKEKGLLGITFTDHLDLDYMEEPGLFDLDIPAYLDSIQSLAQTESSSLIIRKGIELGLQPQLTNVYNEILSSNNFDFVIGSTHVINGLDPYYPKYFSTRDEHTAFLEYYETILKNIQAFPNIDAVGHLDYCFRYGPYPDAAYDTYGSYAEIVDAILSYIIKKDIALEVNSGSYRCGLTEPNPSLSILKRYRQLGGALITVGADAHTPRHVALEFSHLAELLLDCGFTEYAVFQNRTPTFFSI